MKVILVNNFRDLTVGMANHYTKGLVEWNNKVSSALKKTESTFKINPHGEQYNWIVIKDRIYLRNKITAKNSDYYMSYELTKKGKEVFNTTPYNLREA